MGVKQYGSALGHKIVLWLYERLGYDFASWIVSVIAFYYALFTPSVRDELKSYYEHLDRELDFWSYFRHIKNFSLSIFDRFVSRIHPEDLCFERENKEAFVSLQEGGIVLLSHIGGWATAAHSMKVSIPPMNVVMREERKEDISRFEKAKKRQNETKVKILDLNQGAIAVNVQIANALLKGEVVAMMADRVIDPKKAIEVGFLGSKIKINKNPFEIATRCNKALVATFVVMIRPGCYKLIFRDIDTKDKSVEEIAQEYMDILTKIIKNYPDQWYNFFDIFKGQ